MNEKVCFFAFFHFNNFFVTPSHIEGKFIFWDLIISELSHSQSPQHSLPLRGTEPGPNSRLALSHQLKKRGSQDVRDISKTETGSYHDSMDDPWCPSDRSWTRDSVGDVFEVLSISEPGRDVSRSRRTFQITDEHVKS